MPTSIALALLLVLGTTAIAAEPSAQERCEAYQLAATGARISAKLHCRAWAKLTATQVDASCLDKAEKRFLLHLQDGGPGCADPNDVVSLGAAADEQMNAIVEDVEPEAPQMPSVAGVWQTRTNVSLDPDFAWTACELDNSRPCPTPENFVVVECRTDLEQDGTTLHYLSSCRTAADSPLVLSDFTQEATGSIDPVTGEWMLAGTVTVPELPIPISYQGEGVYSPDGRSQTGFTTAGWLTDAGEVLWLATTTGERVE